MQASIERPTGLTKLLGVEELRINEGFGAPFNLKRDL